MADAAKAGVPVAAVMDEIANASDTTAGLFAKNPQQLAKASISNLLILLTGIFFFGLINPSGVEIEKLNLFSNTQFIGDVILFPSSLYHRTIPTKFSGRMVVAFDLLQ